MEKYIKPILLKWSVAFETVSLNIFTYSDTQTISLEGYLPIKHYKNIPLSGIMSNMNIYMDIYMTCIHIYHYEGYYLYKHIQKYSLIVFLSINDISYMH